MSLCSPASGQTIFLPHQPVPSEEQWCQQVLPVPSAKLHQEQIPQQTSLLSCVSLQPAPSQSFLSSHRCPKAISHTFFLPRPQGNLSVFSKIAWLDSPAVSSTKLQDIPSPQEWRDSHPSELPQRRPHRTQPSSVPPLHLLRPSRKDRQQPQLVATSKRPYVPSAATLSPSDPQNTQPPALGAAAVSSQECSRF